MIDINELEKAASALKDLGGRYSGSSRDSRIWHEFWAAASPEAILELISAYRSQQELLRAYRVSHGACKIIPKFFAAPEIDTRCETCKAAELPPREEK